MCSASLMSNHRVTLCNQGFKKYFLRWDWRDRLYISIACIKSGEYSINLIAVFAALALLLLKNYLAWNLFALVRNQLFIFLWYAWFLSWLIFSRIGNAVCG
jgi:hypothetical protein